MKAIVKYLIQSVVLFFLLQGCASTGDPEDPTFNMAAADIYEEASRSLKAGDFEKAILFYERLESRFPHDKLTLRAQMEIAYAYYKDKEPESAILACNRFIKLHPNHPDVDYIYYLRGLASYDLSQTFLQKVFGSDPSERDPRAARRAFEYFAELVKKFPESRYVQDAVERMVFIRNNLAKYEVHVAKYYMSRGAYLAAANRGKYIVENYQQTPSVADALAIMVYSYNKLGMKDLARDTKRILELNYPEHSGKVK